MSTRNIQMRRIVKESLDRQVTAKDLIGASVYDSAGEKIGDIADIGMHGLLSQEAAQAYRSAHTEDEISTTPGATSSTYSRADQTEMAARSERSDLERQSDKLKNEAEKASKDWSSKMGMGSDATVFISVGGLWGIGDDIVAVPANSLSYDSAEEQFTLSASKSQVVALAEQDPSELNDDFSWNDEESQDYSAKQSFDEDISSIREAFASDSALESENYITITTRDDKIVLEGQVSSDSAKERAEQLAEDHTDMDVKNSLKVKK